jgi:hypothetical protein
VQASSVRPVGEKWGWIGQLHRRTDAALGYGLRPREATSGKEGAPKLDFHRGVLSRSGSGR